MSTDVRAPRTSWRSARECALGLCAAWLLVQNLVFALALLMAGPSAAWTVLAPLLGVAFVLMTPLWLVPVVVLAAGRMSGAREASSRRREVVR